MLKSFLCTLLLSMTFSAAALPRVQEDPNSTLTGGGQREWVYGGYSSFSAGERDGECKGSDTWIFSSNGSLTKKMCKNNRLAVESGISWQVYTDGGRLVINIGGTVYGLHLREYQTTGREMILTLDKGSKGNGYDEFRYYYNPSR